MAKQRVLILCTGNSARSQMAEGLLRHDAGDRFAVESAGTRPGSVRPEAIAVMREVGIDISGHRSKSVDEFAGQAFDYVLTVCDSARESCPVYPGHANRIHHRFDDPAAVTGSEEERLAVFRRVRDEIRTYLLGFPGYTRSMHILLVYLTVKPDHVDAFIAATKENARNSREEAGVVRFDVVQEIDNPTKFSLIEIYRTPEALAAHRVAPHYLAWAEKVPDMLVEPRSRTMYRNIDPSDQDW